VKPVAIFAASRWEVRAVHRAFPTAQVTTIAGLRCIVGQAAGQTYWLIRTGIGPDVAGRIAKTVMDAQPLGWAWSTGFACALGSARVGDVIVGTDVTAVRQNGNWTMEPDSIPCDDALRSRCLLAARQAGLPVTVGRVVSASMVVGSATDKQRLSRLSGAAALDMESAALGSAALSRGVPFGVVRTVSDVLDEDLPIDFNLFLRPGGWLRGAQTLLASPAAFAGLNRLRKQSRVAANRLTDLFAGYVGICQSSEVITSS
jgi:adenosylhomocysteine nucleosidase